mgnify:CR=1 FL=1
MKNMVKWFGIALGVLIVILLTVFYFKGSAMLNPKLYLPPDNVSIPTDPASIERGKHLVQVICYDCHTSDLSGKNMISAPFAMIDSANLTPSGPSGSGASSASASGAYAPGDRRTVWAALLIRMSSGPASPG